MRWTGRDERLHYERPRGREWLGRGRREGERARNKESERCWYNNVCEKTERWQNLREDIRPSSHSAACVCSSKWFVPLVYEMLCIFLIFVFFRLSRFLVCCIQRYAHALSFDMFLCTQETGLLGEVRLRHYNNLVTIICFFMQLVRGQISLWKLVSMQSDRKSHNNSSI